jgi:signal transduction histidine kinase
MKSIGFHLLLCLLLLGLSQSVPAQSAVSLDTAHSRLPLGTHLGFIEDSGGRLTIDDVSRPAFSETFLPLNRETLNAGYSASTYWFRFTATNTGTRDLKRFLEVPFPILGEVAFFQPSDEEQGKFTILMAGDALAFSDRVVPHRHLVFPIRVPAGATRTFYLRVRTSGSLTFSAILWEPAAHALKDRREYGFLGVYYGLLLMLFLYNGISFLGTRDRSFLYFLGFVLCLGLFQASIDGLAQEFLWGNAAVPGQIPRNVFINLASALAGLFVREFLSLEKYSRRLDVAARWLTRCFFALAVGFLILPPRPLIQATAALTLVGIVLGVLAPVDALRAGYRPALLFIFAWVPLLMSGLVIILRLAGFAPYTFVTQYFVHGGMAIQTMFFSLALVERIDALRREKAEAEHESALREERMEISLIRNNELQEVLQEREAARLEVERQKAELEEANLKLRELDRIKADFTAMLVHDLKSPLSAVLNACEVIQPPESLKTDPQKAELVQHVHATLDGTITLINDLLEIYRTESDQVLLSRDRLDLHPLLTRACNAARLAGVKTGLSVELEVADSLPPIAGDVQKLDRVLSNLLSNALKFTDAGGRITVSARTVTGSGVEAGITFVEISVTDTGEGIPPAELPYVFDPYRQGTTRSRQLGVGLGLAIVKRVIAAHEGSISVRSQVGVGTTFTVLLPAL